MIGMRIKEKREKEEGKKKKKNILGKE